MEYVKNIEFKGEKLGLTEQQYKQALADAHICRCGDCFVCHIAKHYGPQLLDTEEKPNEKR